MPKVKAVARAREGAARGPKIVPEALKLFPKAQHVGPRPVGLEALVRQHGLTQEEAAELIHVFKRSKELLLKLDFSGANNGETEKISFTKPFPEIIITRTKINDTPFFELFSMISGILSRFASISAKPGGIGDDPPTQERTRVRNLRR
jgi:hypothetical protein